MSLQPMMQRARWLLLSYGLALACGDERPPAAVPDSACPGCDAGSGGSAGQGNAGSAGSENPGGSGGSDLSDGGISGSAGSADGGGVTLAVCGNGVQEGEENCDGSDFGELSCLSFGYSEGTLSCADCVASPSGCSGTEVCSDGADNDGDGAADCADTDCAALCANFCVAPTPLQNGEMVSGNIHDQLAPEPSSCTAEEPTTTLVFAYAAPQSGVADVFLNTSSAGLALSVRTTCDQSASELACSASSSGATPVRQLTVPITQGETLFMVVESSNPEVPSAFSLVASAREVACGDGFVDLEEECDDGNFNDADGCNMDCVFQPDESEPNATLAEANTYLAPEFFGAVSERDDIDIVSLAVTAGQRLVVETFDLGNAACARLELDNQIDVLDGLGNVVATDDDSGTGFCAALITGPLETGDHYVRVRASGTAESFQYRLSLSLDDP